MRFFSLIKEENILLNPEMSLREDILAKMVSHLLPGTEEMTLNKIITKIIQHEDSPWFAPAPGVVVPHARIDEADEFKLAVAVSKEPMLWEQHKDETIEVNVVFLVLTPTYQNMKMIQTLDAIDRFCELRHNIDSLRHAVTEAKAIRQFEESGIDVKSKLTAEFLMNTELRKITPEHSLRDAAAIMIRNEEDDAVPVVNEQNELLGEFTSQEILKVGVPNYMNMLNNVDFLTNFEPFENYYKKERFMKVKELINNQHLTIDPDASVIEVAYELISKGKRRIYVVKNKKLLGVIFRKDLISKILLA